MLRKLIKHEVLFGYKTFLACMAMMAVFGMHIGDMSVPNGIFEELVVMVPYFVGGIFLVTMIRSYYSSLFSSQGYLTLTLPVKLSTTVFVKTLVTVVWFVAIMGAMLLADAVGPSMAGENMVARYPADIMQLALGALNVVLGVYVAISVAHSFGQRWSRWWTTACTIVTLAAAEFVGYRVLYACFGELYSFKFFSSGDVRITNHYTAYSVVHGDPNAEVTTLCDVNLLIVFLVFSVALYCINQYLVTKKINLD